LAWDFSFARVTEDHDVPTTDRGWLTVRVLHGGHLGDDMWSEIEPIRQRQVERSRVGLDNLWRVFRDNDCSGILIAESYRIDVPGEFATRCLASCAGATGADGTTASGVVTRTDSRGNQR